MYKPTRDDVLNRPELPTINDSRYVKVQGDWESNHFADDGGVVWYPVTYKAVPHKKKVLNLKR